MNTPLQPFEPDYLIRLVYAQYPHRNDIMRALQLCSAGHWESEKYIYFIGSRLSLVPNKESQVVESLVLSDEEEGRIVVDVVADGRVAGIGYFARVAQ